MLFSTSKNHQKRVV